VNWIGENLGAFSIIISIIIVIAGAIAFQQYSKAITEMQKRTIDAYKDENDILRKQIDACRSEAGQFKRYKGTLRYALGRLGFNIIDNGDFITLIEKGSKKMHTMRMKATVDEQIEKQAFDEEEDEGLED
jgi:hypothetical protein